MYTNELMGFVVFKRTFRGPSLLVRKKTIGLSASACRVLGSPEYVLVFLDERKRRVMLKAAEQGQENAYLLSQGGGIRGCVCSLDLCAALSRLFGKKDVFRLQGHAPQGTERTLIFEEEEA